MQTESVFLCLPFFTCLCHMVVIHDWKHVMMPLGASTSSLSEASASIFCNCARRSSYRKRNHWQVTMSWDQFIYKKLLQTWFLLKLLLNFTQQFAVFFHSHRQGVSLGDKHEQVWLLDFDCRRKFIEVKLPTYGQTHNSGETSQRREEWEEKESVEEDQGERNDRKHMSNSKGTKHTILGALLKVDMFKTCTRLRHFAVNMYKTPQLRSAFGSWD